MNTRNIKTVKITVPTEKHLNRLNDTPTLSRLSRNTLKVGENIERVNHYQFADMIRMYPIVGCSIEEINY